MIMRTLDFFNLPNPTCHTMALGLTQPVTKMSTRKYFWGVERDWRIRLTTSLLHCLQNPVIKMCSSIIIANFICLKLFSFV
jgi:hypothetical protein